MELMEYYVSQSFRLAVQQLINDYGRYLNSSNFNVTNILADNLLNWLEAKYVEHWVNL